MILHDSSIKNVRQPGVSPLDLVRYKLKRTATENDLLGLSYHQVVDIANGPPDNFDEDNERLRGRYLKWIFGSRWRDYELYTLEELRRMFR